MVEAMLDAVMDRGIVRLDSQGIVVDWTAGAQLLLGYSDSEVVGQPVSMFHTDAGRSAGWLIRNWRRPVGLVGLSLRVGECVRICSSITCAGKDHAISVALGVEVQLSANLNSPVVTVGSGKPEIG